MTQISCGTRTKCRKTRAMQRDFAIAAGLSLRAVRAKPIGYAFWGTIAWRALANQHRPADSLFGCARNSCDTSMVPYTHLLKLLFVPRYINCLRELNERIWDYFPESTKLYFNEVILWLKPL